MNLSAPLLAYASRNERVLDAVLPKPSQAPGRLHEAMRYSVLGGGKRMRPLLVYATTEAFGAPVEHGDAAAAAVELIHAYSLIHDDLPAMDDDDLRRGQPTCHRQFDEATAILAGDALQALAFEVLAGDRHLGANAATQIECVRVLAAACGSAGMAGGQAIDLGSVGISLSAAELERMHAYKTGALIRASVRLGGLSSLRASRLQLDALDRYARAIGLAFQIRDDILDVEGDTAVIGKQQGADIARDKPTYPAILGLDASKRLAADLVADALAALHEASIDGGCLAEIARYVVGRAR